MTSSVPVIPALRFGKEYTSLETSDVVDLGTGEVLAKLGIVPDALIATDCLRGGKMDRAFEVLQAIPIKKRVEMCVRGADIFATRTLMIAGVAQSIDDYHWLLARTSGLSLLLAKGNTERISKGALEMTPAIVDGLSRGLPHEVFDTGVGEQGGATVRIVPRAKCVGCCMPGNAPGVHVTWLPALALGIPVLIRPGSAEPFTPLRLIAALIEAGFPKEVFGYYPCGHGGADLIPELTGAAMVFGSDATVGKWKGNPLVQRHGAGFSKVFVGPDRMSGWSESSDSLVQEIALSVCANSGRSCFNASMIVVPSHGREFANALAKHMGSIVPRPLDHDDARLSAMAMPAAAKGANQVIEVGLKAGGATNCSAPYQSEGRLVEFEGRTYMLPTVVFCESMDHVLARQEFLFPYVAVVEASMDEAFAKMGKTLSLAVYTGDESLQACATRSHVDLVSINKGTPFLDRLQPHSGGMFDLCYERKSLVVG